MMEHSSDEDRTSVSAEDFASKRASVRDSLLLVANFRVEGGEDEQVRVRNLSAGGLMAEYAVGLERGCPVEVEVRGVGWVRGTIAWSTDGRVGIAFDHEIDPLAARKPVGGGSNTPSYVKPIITRR